MARGFPVRSNSVRLVFDADVWLDEREAVVAELLLVGVDCWDRASELMDDVTEAVSEELDSGRVVILTPRLSLLRIVSRDIHHAPVCKEYTYLLAGATVISPPSLVFTLVPADWKLSQHPLLSSSSVLVE
jgi:hypothetical protein